jgi:uncharacterized protein YaeQ
MALKSTVFKAQLSIADMDRGYYADHSVTIARHPSENDERMMMRLLAFVLHAGERLTFGKGLSDPDEPDLLVRDLTGAIEQWIEVGTPDERAILKACGKAEQVAVLAYASSTDTWWAGIEHRLQRARNLSVLSVLPDRSQALAGLAQRTMQLQCTVQDGSVWMSDAQQQVQLDVTRLMAPAEGPAGPRGR